MPRRPLTPCRTATPAASLCAPQLVWNCCFGSDLITYRHIPGPMPVPVIGNLWFPGIRHKKMLFNAYSEWREKYGKMYRWFCGAQCLIVVAGAWRTAGARCTCSARSGGGTQGARQRMMAGRRQILRGAVPPEQRRGRLRTAARQPASILSAPDRSCSLLGAVTTRALG
jgi:hypothetical protein